MKPPRHVILCAADPAIRRWVSEELAGEACDVLETETVAELVAAVAASARRPVLILDVDALSATDLVELQPLRQQRRVAAAIGLGTVPRDVRAAVRITHVVPRPFGSEGLRVILSETDDERDTFELKKLDG
jgi:DNA-binding NtrC family response regulator